MNPKDDEEKDVVSYAAEPHKLGTSIGAAGGVIAGAALGSSLGPLGAVTGAVLGGAFGAVAGAGIAAGIDPEAEEAYWQRRYRDEPYYESEYTFDDYGPAYKMGWQLYSPHVSFDASEKAMSDDWGKGRGVSKLDWPKARHAAKASWEKVHSSQKPVD
ncbi:MAG: hypothetical protein ABIS50_18660 [Luteolibacter sp.]|uniref:hypothetical protein n=1 Tax=Luteolibacter sp. TaxID=1962973 RepID=UPI00326355A5